MAGVAAFMIVSSIYKIPVSATHAIVGASLASSLYLRGNVGIRWNEIVGIEHSKITDMHTPVMNSEEIHNLPWYKYFYTAVPEDRLTTKVFNALQIVSSSLLSFSHGANDTANTVGPLLAVWLTYHTGYAFGAAETRDDSQVLLAFGAVAMIFGFLSLGHRTIKLIAQEITVDMSPVSGFAIELGTAFTVLVCVKAGIPVSSTHCAVGAVLFVGMTKSTTEGVSFKTFRKICIVWLLCFPVAAAISLVVTIILVKLA
ncbi:unnamed protein product [Angiostrongylus costaricensis]|uniref:Phosphate transporter n=1 Tax=Angiostrongylus costaricensis TaxID=334426 RepID=A0A0R3PNF1_ANGCS|nr:unnamed protein product [Angiostrongylus costaricensis]